MKKENSTKKGYDFEIEVFNVLKEMLEDDRLYQCGKKSTIFLEKKYYSTSRSSDIIFDISIETWLPDADKYSLLTVIECKNYGKKGVPVNDIEEFSSKLEQVGKHNIKGIVITNSRFQESAFNLAVSLGIALVCINEKQETKWLNYRIDKEQRFSMDLMKTIFVSDKIKHSILSYYNNYFYTNIPNILIKIGVIDRYINNSKFIKVPYKTTMEIENTIKSFSLNKYYYNEKLDLELLCKHLEGFHNCSFDFSSDLGYDNSRKILGNIAFNPLRISVTKDLSFDQHRWRFTVAHEIGHLFLHYNILKKYFIENYDNEETFAETKDHVQPFINKRLELQANLFAGIILIPRHILIKHVKSYFLKERINKDYLYLDNQICNINLVNKLLIELSNIFEVSKQALKVRLESQKLLVDGSKILSIGKIMEEMF